MSLKRALPPLTALIAFEAAARLSSFSRAATELGVTQAAVSRQIKALEDDLGLPLFRRLHRRVELTEAGATLASRLARAFNDVAGTIAELRRSAGAELVVAATLAFSQFRLLPRLSAFRLAHPDLRLRLVAQDEPVDLARDGVDVAIRYGMGTWSDGEAHFLHDDRVVLVASPAFLARHGPVESLEAVIAAPLIGYDVPDPSWMRWGDWLAACGRPGPAPVPAFRCNHYTDAISAALAGEGITLGWRWLVDRSLALGTLVQVTNAQVVPDGGYYAVTPASRTPKPGALALAQWLASEAPTATS